MQDVYLFSVEINMANDMWNWKGSFILRFKHATY